VFKGKIFLLRKVICTLNALILIVLRLISVFGDSPNFGVAVFLYYIFVSSAAVILTVGYLFHWRKLIALISDSKMSQGEKSHRTAKLSQVLLIFTVCLDVGLIYTVLLATASMSGKLDSTQLFSPALTFMMGVLPEWAACCTAVYFFSPLKILKQDSDSSCGSTSTDVQLCGA